MQPIPLIRSNILNGVVRLLEEEDIPSQPVLLAANLSTAALRNPEGLLPLKNAFIFYEKAAQATGCDTLGALAGQKLPLEELGAFGRVLLSSTTLNDAIQTTTQLINTYNSGDRFWIVDDGPDRIKLCRAYTTKQEEGRQQADHYALTLVMKLIRLAAGDNWFPEMIHLETGRSKALEKFLDVSGECKFYYNQAASAITIAKKDLSLPMQTSFKEEQEQIKRDEAILLATAPANNFIDSLRQVIEFNLREGKPDIHHVADLTNISARTLQRRLEDENLTYSQLVEQTRYQLAMDLLKDDSLSLADAAAELGYGHAVNFTRAFKRWTGVSPSEFRRQMT